MKNYECYQKYTLNMLLNSPYVNFLSCLLNELFSAVYSNHTYKS